MKKIIAGKYPILRLIKVGKKEHIESLQKNGILFLNPIHYFKGIEGDGQRRDAHEGIIHLEQVPNLKFIKEDGSEFKIKTSNARLRVTDDDQMGNIFCTIAITREMMEKSETLDKQNMEFGDTFLVITHHEEFLRRIDVATKKLGKTCSHKLVDYYDEENYSGYLGIFWKSMRYKHQNEFRIFIKNDQNEPLILKIGSIDDISQMFSITDFERITFEMVTCEV